MAIKNIINLFKNKKELCVKKISNVNYFKLKKVRV